MTDDRPVNVIFVPGGDAAHPEGYPSIGRDALKQALVEKQQSADYMISHRRR